MEPRISRTSYYTWRGDQNFFSDSNTVLYPEDHPDYEPDEEEENSSINDKELILIDTGNGFEEENSSVHQRSPNN